MERDSLGDYGRFVDGRSRDDGDPFAVRDPATRDRIATAYDAGPDGIDDAVGAARAAQADWAATDPRERGRVLRDVADAIRDETERLARIETAETGKPLSQSRLFVDWATNYLEYYGGLTDKIEGETIPLGEGYLDYTKREPYGVTGPIIPWNVPSLLSLRGIAPALATGNAVVAKPAPEAPLVVLEFARIAHEAGLPAGVWNAVPGDGANTGAALTEHAGVDKLVFTGSDATATRVMTAAADTLTPVTLETGGKSPSIVFPDADLDDAVEDTLHVFDNAGQVCFATTRAFVHTDVYDEYAERIAAAASDLTVGPGEEDHDVGPLITADARDAVAEYVDDAAAAGARVLAGGEIPRDDGNYYAPTVVDRVADDAPISCDEVFGPVLTLYEFDDEAEAIRRANDTRYGLYATVWTHDVSRAHRVADDLEAGTVTVNEFPVTAPQAPFGGYKQSGIGREKGVQAVDEYTQSKNVIVSLDDA